MTGQAVHQHQVQQFSDRLTPGHRPLAAVLRDHGYETRGITDGNYLKSEFGFDVGFDFYDAGRVNLEPNWDDAVQWIQDRESEATVLPVPTNVFHPRPLPRPPNPHR